MRWLQVFCKGDTFPNPACLQSLNNNNTPFIFQNNPDLHMSVLYYCSANLASLSGDMLHTYLFDIALPQSVKVTQAERSKVGINSNFTLYHFLHKNHLVKLFP
jgi:hypothetical protein